MKRCLFALVMLVLMLPMVSLSAQSDALNLPTDLYVLLNDGVIQRYGIGTSGVETITPEGEFVIDFAVSADGAQLAYRTEAGVFLADMTAALPLAGQVVDSSAGVPPVRGRGETIAWTPQGDAVAYTTLTGARVYYPATGAFANVSQAELLNLLWSPGGTYLLAEADANIWWVYRREAVSLALAAAMPSSIGAAWVGTTQIAFAPADGGLIVMDVSAGNGQVVLLDDTNEHRLPHLAPDGRLLFFRRLKTDETVPTGYGQLVALAPGAQAVDVMGSASIDLTGGLRWAPGGGLMIAFQGGVMALFDPVTGQGFPLPITGAVAYGWGAYPPPAPDADATPEAIFPDAFPTLDPLTPLPAMTPVIEATETAEPDTGA